MCLATEHNSALSRHKHTISYDTHSLHHVLLLTLHHPDRNGYLFVFCRRKTCDIALRPPIHYTVSRQARRAEVALALREVIL